MLFKFIPLGFTAGIYLLRYYFGRARYNEKHHDQVPVLDRFHDLRTRARKLMKQVHADLEYQGFEQIAELEAKDQKYLMVCNHQGAMDPLPIFAMLEYPLLPVSKIELKKVKIFRRIFASVDAKYIDRKDLRQTIRVIREVADILKNGESSVIIYPEGTRNRNPETTGVADFHAGSLKIATMAKAPIVVMACYGMFRLLSKKHRYRRYPVQFHCVKVIQPEEYANMDSTELSQYVQSLVEQEIARMKVRDKYYLDHGYHKMRFGKSVSKYED